MRGQRLPKLLTKEGTEYRPPGDDRAVGHADAGNEGQERCGKRTSSMEKLI